jgi:ribonuclease HII
VIRGAFCYSIYMKIYVGIDEVGRGPLAGPVCVGVFCCDQKTLKWLLKNAPCKITDSKKMTHSRRAQIVSFLETHMDHIEYKYAIGYTAANIIDTKGIVFAINTAIKKALAKLSLGTSEYYLLDGGLKLPPEFKNQKTIIKGDLVEPMISLASIVAKESRDEYMRKLSKKYPGYGFEKHMGYGTLEHRRVIQKVGQIGGVHRKSFIKSGL